MEPTIQMVIQESSSRIGPVCAVAALRVRVPSNSRFGQVPNEDWPQMHCFMRVSKYMWTCCMKAHAHSTLPLYRNGDIYFEACVPSLHLQLLCLARSSDASKLQLQ